MDIYTKEHAVEFLAERNPQPAQARGRYQQALESFIDFAVSQGWTTGATPTSAITLWGASQGFKYSDIVAAMKVKAIREYLDWARTQGATIREGIESPTYPMDPAAKEKMQATRAETKRKQAEAMAKASEDALALKKKVKDMEMQQKIAADQARVLAATPPAPPPVDQLQATAPTAPEQPEATIFPPAEPATSIFTFKPAPPPGKGHSPAMAHLTSRGHKVRVWEQRPEASELVHVGEVTVAAIDQTGALAAALQQRFVLPYMHRYQYVDTAHFWVAAVDPKTGAVSEKVSIPVDVPRPPDARAGYTGAGIGAASPLGQGDPITQGFALLDALAARDADGAKSLEQRLRALTGRPDGQSLEVQLAIRDCLSEIKDFRRDSRDALEKTRQDLAQALAQPQGPSLGMQLDMMSRREPEPAKPSTLDAFLATEMGKNVIGAVTDKLLAEPEMADPLQTLKLAKEILAPAHDPHVAALTGQIAQLAQGMANQTAAIVAELRSQTKPAANAVDEFLSGMVKYDDAMKKLRGGNNGGTNWMDFMLGLAAIVGPRLDKVLDIAVAGEFGAPVGAEASSPGSRRLPAAAAPKQELPAEIKEAVRLMLSSSATDDILAGYATVMSHLRSTPEGVARTDKMVELSKQSNGKMLLVIGISDELQKMGFGDIATIPRVRRVVETLHQTILASMAAAEQPAAGAATGGGMAAAAGQALPASTGAQTLQPASGQATPAPLVAAPVLQFAQAIPPAPLAAPVAPAGEEHQWEPAAGPPATPPVASQPESQPATAAAEGPSDDEEDDDDQEDSDVDDTEGDGDGGGDGGPPSADDLIEALEEMPEAEMQLFFKKLMERQAAGSADGSEGEPEASAEQVPPGEGQAA